MTNGSWAVLLVILAAVGWVSTVILVVSARRVDEYALTERATAGVILSVIASLFAGLSLAFLLNVRLEAGTVTAALVTIGLLANAPQIIWAVALTLGRFR